MERNGRAEQLSALTSAFYERVHGSFSATRQAPWLGWDELWRVTGSALEQAGEPLDVLDAACGNLRFARFLQQKTAGPFRVFGLDGCEPLLREGLAACSEAGLPREAVQVRQADIASALRAGEDPFAGVPACGLAVAFGFLHHLPEARLRARLLEKLAAHATPGGFVAASFWQFADDERLRAKAEEATARALAAGDAEGLEPAAGDYVLGWQGDAEALRFCHHFTEDEIDRLSAGLGGAADEVARFSADGKSGRLNRYVVWRRHA